MFWGNRKSRDFSAEIEAHIALETDRLREQGYSEADARSAARRAFGNVGRTEERFHESTRWVRWDNLCGDIRYPVAHGGGRGRRRAGSFAVADRLIKAQLFGVKPVDPLTFVTVAVILQAVALAAACIPAYRASRVDPMVALRHEKSESS